MTSWVATCPTLTSVTGFSEVNLKKFAPEVLMGIGLIVVPLFFIQMVHVIVHGNHCKTHSEWVETLDDDIQSLIKNRMDGY